ncbi:sensor histidine kinase [Haliangium ochraceum]|uniref:sensor histidine kinase n=1 Tax=Haliangium ochraceum TaxID=80816 RepID=UPI00030B8798|nr:HAMP domain-containing sensor histidine kinase [Haliangium ochraceum]
MYTTVDEAREQAARPDALIVVHRSVGMNGVGLVRELRRNDKALVALVVTRRTDEAATATAIAEVGHLFHVYEPCWARDVLCRVDSGLEQQRLRRELSRARAESETWVHALDSCAGEVQRAEAELRTTHSSLRTATERLVEAEQIAAVGRVAAAIAHELSRQLALVGYAEAIKSRVAEDPELVELADIIVAAQKRLASMIDEIRDFATGDAREVRDLRREPADMAAVVDEALAIMRYDRDVCRRVIERRYRARPLAALHRQKFSQVIINLISNAVVATRPGDVIEVELDVDESSADAGPGTATLTVRDSGVGMSPEVLARLGEPFFTTRAERGSGLGVGICMRIIEEHGGVIGYESELGRGTTARIAIPLLSDGAIGGAL